MVIVDLFILIAVVLAVAYYQLQAVYWVSLVGATLLILSVANHLGLVLFLCWLLYIPAAVLVLMPAFRKQYFTNHVMQLLQKRLPPIGQTEKEALESGDSWWEKDLLSGNPDWNKLLAYPKPSLTPEEQNFLDNQVETLCAMLNDWQLIRYDEDLSKKVWAYLKQEKFFGLVIPKEFGGLGFSAFAHSCIVLKVATRSVSAAVNMMVPNSLGPGELLLHYGTPDQKAYYLPRLAKGEEIPCFALTAPDAGSDAASIIDSGVICYERFQGQKTLGIRLNWDKRYITLAPIATLLGLAIHLYDPEHLLSDKVDIGITLCLIPTAHPGVEIGRRHLPMYLAFMNGPTRGKDVFIPLGWIIGGPDRVGQGWHMLMECLSIGRSISLPALSTASAQMSYRITGAYARIRKQFNLPIANFEGVEELLSSIAGLTYQMEAARTLTAGAVDLKIKPTIASAIAKYQMTEMSRDIINKAMDIHAGHGIQTGPNNLLANIYMAMPISITVEGANALTRNLIIFGQGVMVCHPYLLQEVELLTQASSQVDAFDEIFMKHTSYALRNLARTIWYSLTGGRLIQVSLEKPQNNKKLKYFYQQLTLVSTLLALFTDLILVILGGDLKRRERTSARLGDVLSQLYLASAVLKHFQDQGQPDEEWPYAEWCIKNCLHQTQVAFRELANNFPIRWMGWLLRFVIPYGKAFSRPSDQLGQQLLLPMLSPGALRDRLTKNIYLPKNPEEWFVQLEETLKQVNELEPLAKKFQNGLRHGKVPAWKNFSDQLEDAVKSELLTKEEAQALSAYEKQRQAVIKVNEFSFDLNKVVS